TELHMLATATTTKTLCYTLPPPPHPHCPVSSPQLQKATKTISPSSCSYPIRTELHLPTPSDSPTLSFLGHCSGPYSRSFAQSSAERFECLDCHNEHLSFMGLAKCRQLRCEWSSKKYFNCKYCEKEYISLGALKMHIRTHTLPCVCKLCGKAFSRPWLLQGHIRTHTGEKPFSCFHCSRAFADRSNLRAHLQTHSEMKRYQCACCLKTFSRISLLAKHQEAGCPVS
uniref:Zinc finger protein SNAI2 n=1 Tax=Takifugu rubripes TaxID=31033 RepID=A0A674P9E8_TAKRU